MATIASVDIALTANSAQLRRGLDEAERRTRRFTRRAQGAYAALNRTVASLRNTFVTFAAVIGTGAFTRLADDFININSQLRASGVQADELSETFARVQNIAIETRASLTGTAALFTRINRLSNELQVSQGEVLIFTRSIQQLLALSGVNAQEASNAVIQLSQGLASGTLRGDELRSVLEQAPIIVRLIAQELDVSFGRIRDLAAEGQITADVVLRAILNRAGQINTAFQSTQTTFNQLGTIFRTRITPALGEIGQVLLPTVARVLEVISSLLSGLTTILPGLIPVLTAAFAIFLTGRLVRLINALRVRMVELGRTGAAAFNGLRIGGVRARVAIIQTGVAVFNLTSRLFGAVAAHRAFIVVTTVATTVTRGFALAISALGGPINIIITAFTILATVFADEFVAALRIAANFFIRAINSIISGLDSVLRFFGGDGITFRLEEFSTAVQAASVDTSELDETIRGLTTTVMDEAEPALSSFQETLQNALDMGARISEFGSNTFDRLADSLTDFVTTGRLQIREFARDVIAEFIRIQIRGALARSFTSFGFPGITPRQFGGPVTAGQPYLVGETGPELFVPSQSGEIIANNQLTGNPQGNVTINISAVDTQSFQTALARDPSFITSLAERGNRQLGRR